MSGIFPGEAGSDGTHGRTPSRGRPSFAGNHASKPRHPPRRSETSTQGWPPGSSDSPANAIFVRTTRDSRNSSCRGGLELVPVLRPQRGGTVGGGLPPDRLWALLLARDFSGRDHYSLAEPDRRLKDVYQPRHVGRHRLGGGCNGAVHRSAEILFFFAAQAPMLWSGRDLFSGSGMACV